MSKTCACASRYCTAARSSIPLIWGRLLCLMLLVLLGVPGLSPAHAAQLAAARDHSYLLRDDGTLWAWGENDFSQLGDGSTLARATPLKVLAGVAAVAGGPYHSLALKTDGSVWSWGFNGAGQLGSGNTLDQTVPAQALVGARAVAASGLSSFVVKTDGTLWAWGDNEAGQLGDGSQTHRASPVQVLSGVRAVVAAGSSSFALKTDNTLWAWGDNTQGQLGNGNTSNQSTPIQILSAVAAVASSGISTLALKIDGSLWAWGNNDWGQLGDGGTSSRVSPVPVMGGVKALAAGGSASYAVRIDDTLWSWGANDWGQLGDGGGISRATPAQVLAGVSTVAAGLGHALALKSDGSIWAWGNNAGGQLGDGSSISRGLPVYPVSGAQTLAAGAVHALAVKADGTLWAWGDNAFGQLGDGTQTSRELPVQVLSGVRNVAAGEAFSLARKADGSLWSWGDNASGQLGDGSNTPRGAPLQVASGIEGMAAGYRHGLLIKTDSSLWTWGDNTWGQLGDGGTSNRNTPAQVLSAVSATAGGSGHSVALRTDGTVWTWGANNEGQLGDGGSSNRGTPAQVLAGAIAIAAGDMFTLALKTDGSVWSWGANYEGQLGDGSLLSRASPALIMTGVQAIAAGNTFALALKGDGTVWAWGSNAHQVLGAGAADRELRPRQHHFLRGLQQIAAGWHHALGLSADGRIAVWGAKLGFAIAATPGRVLDPLAPYANAVLVTEHYNPNIRNSSGNLGTGHYFITAGADERAGIAAGAAGPGWSDTGRNFRAWATANGAPGGAAGVCRFYVGEPNSHFYTASPIECQGLRGANPTNNPALGPAYEGVAFFTVLPDSGACASGYFPVYRAYNNRFGPPANNDGNHRMTPSYNDHRRGLRFLGYVDEGIAFCSPTSPYPGGDLQATFIYPGASAQAGASLNAEFVFSNNGPGDAHGGTFFAVLPAEVAAWSITCSARQGASCPDAGSLGINALRAGISLNPWPAGGGITLQAQGTAPQASSGSDVTLNFAASVLPASGWPDGAPANNTPPAGQTVVGASNVCNFVVNPTYLSLAAMAQAPHLTVNVGEGCAWTTQSASSWITVGAGGSGSGSLVVNVAANIGGAERTGSLSVAGLQVLVRQAGAAGAPAVSCNSLRLSRSGDQVAAGWITSAINLEVIVDASCQWQALSQASWISIVAGGAGQGKGTVSYRTDANTGESPRAGTIQIGSQSFTVTQFGASEGPGGDGGGDGGGE
ncbi:MAG: hypothetical protein HYZ17_17760 [Betaproteobacteria bacterium]|nr:hypothetical protein [Betaproteobacteria bacterium]